MPSFLVTIAWPTTEMLVPRHWISRAKSKQGRTQCSFGMSHLLTSGNPIRSLLWEHLNRFKVRAFTCQGLRHSYWTDRLPLERILLRVPYAGFAKDSKVLHSFVKQPNALLIALNSLIESQLNPEEGKHLVSLTSSIQTASNRELHMEGKAFILGAQLNIDKVFHLVINLCQG